MSTSFPEDKDCGYFAGALICVPGSALSQWGDDAGAQSRREGEVREPIHLVPFLGSPGQEVTFKVPVSAHLHRVLVSAPSRRRESKTPPALALVPDSL